MRKQKWSGQHLQNLLHLTWEQFTLLYPQTKKSNWRALRRVHLNKINNGEKPMPQRPEHEPNLEEIAGRLTKTWEVSAWNSSEQQWETTTNHAYDHTSAEAPEGWQPAQPAKITPSRRKAPQRDHRAYFAFGDAQIDYRRMDDNELVPLHDERAMRVARLICRDIQPDEIINLGDHVDLSGLSRFKPDSDHFFRTMGPSFQRAHDYYAELRADNPHAKIVEVSSNHEVRLRDWVLKHMPQIYGMRRPGEDEDYPIMTYPYLANLKAVDVTWVGGYGAAEYIINGDLAFRHGRETSSNGTTASKIMKNHPETNNVHGHSHEMSMATKTLRSGRILASLAVGALCRTDGVVPGFHSAVDDDNRPVHRQQNWAQSVLAIYDYGDGHYQYDQIPIMDGKAYYKGKEYTGDDNEN